MHFLSRTDSDFFRHIRKQNGPRGIAAVEVAFCLPVLLLITLLLIEFTNLIFLRQTLKVASYEGIRVAVKQGAELSDITDVVDIILDSRKVTNYEISVEPEDSADLERGTLITVTISADNVENQLFGLLLTGNENIQVESYGLKE